MYLVCQPSTFSRILLFGFAILAATSGRLSGDRKHPLAGSLGLGGTIEPRLWGDSRGTKLGSSQTWDF